MGTRKKSPQVDLEALRERHLVAGRPLPRSVVAALHQDARPAAQRLLKALEARRTADRAESLRLTRMTRFERALWSQGVERVAGVDEAGMSPLAGPVCAAAVILPVGTRIPGVDDSKKLRPEQRAVLADEIRRVALAWSVAFVEPAEIDTVNIHAAGLLCMRRAVRGLAVVPQHILLDARTLKEIPVPQQGIIRGDQLSLSIAAASILAKTSRDARMEALDRVYPGYGFARHKGYPVKEHQQALQRLGATPIHRTTFAPVRKVLGLPPLLEPVRGNLDE